MGSTEDNDFDFSKRAEKYNAGVEGKLSRKFYEALLSQVRLSPNASVLDVGCGTGYLLSEIAKKETIDGYGIDLEEAMIAVAKRACPDMSIASASCDAMPFEDGSFDVVVACMAYHHFANKPGFVSEAYRVLRPQGMLYIADPRFPAIVRLPLNAIFRTLRIAGAFYSPDALASQLAQGGFTRHSVYAKGYVQVIGMRKA